VFAALGLPFEVDPTDLNEDPRPGEAPIDLAHRLAEAKATLAASRHPGAVAIGSDTVVALDGRSLGKPASPDEAVAMLRALRGREHRVITAVAAACRANETTRVWTEVATTRVWMRDYRDDEIADYVASGDPMDKAGAYAIQHEGFHPVERIEGCYLTVVGLPLLELRSVLERAGVTLGRIASAALDSLCRTCPDRRMLVGDDDR